MDDFKDVKHAVGKQALLVEDNEINAEIAMLVLQDMGFKVDWVSNGAEAVENFGISETGYYSLVIMDIMMPVMDGLEATKLIRRLDRDDAKSVPIVAITANAFPEDKEASYQNGVTTFVTKPYGRQQLQQVIETLLQ
ncbi:MAG: response regulator [Lachnospiraceae bacterium]|jgi:CheY-like chemotaxis protein|nr:response regulator [Lachnospiraceae bacterium]MBP5599027.1 response regulator [Lachnospiraceae bacterium]MBR5357208.1 response regulator [Lachnospiraceae bacterium]